jgi:hypothetical protein
MARTGNGTRGLTYRWLAVLFIAGALALVGATELYGQVQVEIDNISGTVSGTGATNPFSFTIPAGCVGDPASNTFKVGIKNHRWLVVSLALNNSFFNGYQATGITWAVTDQGTHVTTTQTLNRVQSLDATGDERSVAQYDLDSPTSGDGCITVTVNQATAYVAGAIAFWNVTSRGPNTCDTPLGGHEDQTATVTYGRTYLKNGEVDFFAVPGDRTAANNASQTKRWDGNSGILNTDLHGGGSTRPGADPTTTMTWTLTGGNTDWVECSVDYRPFQPNLAHVRDFTAIATGRGNLLRWQTSFEADNLGFRIFRDGVDGARVLLTPALIAGSALFAGAGTVLPGGRSYQWIDRASGRAPGDRYWVEEIGLDGARALHGPLVAATGGLSASAASVLPDASNSPLLSSLGVAAQAATTTPQARRVLRPDSNLARQWQLAGTTAAKIGVREEGWYRVTKADLLAAGFDPGEDPSALRLYLSGREQAISIVDGGDGRFDGSDAIEFYGTGADTAFTDTRVYWLVKDTRASQPALRIETAPALSSSTGALRYAAVAERRDRSVYFGAFKDESRASFFGPVITADAVEQALTLDHISAYQSVPPTLEVAVQGATDVAHVITVTLNGHALGEIAFESIVSKSATFSLDPTWLCDGNNTVTLVAAGGDTDVSLVDTVRLNFQRDYVASADTLRFAVMPLTGVLVSGFSTPHVRVVDVTRPESVVELPGRVVKVQEGYGVTVAAPQSQGPSSALFAFTEEQVRRPASIAANAPSSWHDASNQADLAIITHADFAPALNDLKALRESQGLKTAIIDVQDLFDEFSYGLKDPQAIRDALARAATWQRAPQFVLLVGDASVDPRNYLGLGNADYVPTKLVDISVLKTASDDWFVDFNDSGMPQMAIGRIPVRTASEARAVVAKLVAFDATASTADWKQRAAFIADANDDTLRVKFEDAAKEVEGHVPAAMARSEVFIGSMDKASARSAILDALNAGSRVVTYIGHGSDQTWSQQAVFSGPDAAALSNGAKLPVVSALSCLNGLFEDPYGDSLAEALLKAPAGGAVAVLASSALTETEFQLALANRFYDALFASPGVRIGQALVAAKAAETNRDVRRSFMIFGDPSMMLK